jgi:hypothetical protein
VLTRAFDCPQFRAKLAFAHSLDEPGHEGKHIALNHDRAQQILDWNRQNEARRRKTSVTKREIMDYCATQFQIKLIRG